MCGLLIGAAGLGNLADLIGRRKALLVGMTGGLVTNASIFFVHDQYTFTILRLLASAFAHGVVIVGFVYVAEFVGPQQLGSCYLFQIYCFLCSENACRHYN